MTLSQTFALALRLAQCLSGDSDLGDDTHDASNPNDAGWCVAAELGWSPAIDPVTHEEIDANIFDGIRAPVLAPWERTGDADIRTFQDADIDADADEIPATEECSQY